MIKNSYAHTIRVSGFSLDDINILYKIFNCGYLLSRRALIQEKIVVPNKIITEETSVYNGMDYISLCDMQKEHDFYSSYNMYVRNGLSLLFSHGLKVIEPTVVNNVGRLFIDLDNMHNLGLKDARYTDLRDEVQVKDKLSLDYLIGLSLSKSVFLNCRNNDYLTAYLEMVREVIDEYKANLLVYNLDDGKVLSKK